MQCIPLALHGHVVFVSLTDGELPVRVARAAESKGASTTEDRTAATLLVVEDVSKLGKRDLCAASMHGLHVANATYILTCGTSGQRVKYKPALRTPRQCWLTDACKAGNPALVALMEAMVQTGGGKTNRWRLLDTEADVLTLA